MAKTAHQALNRQTSVALYVQIAERLATAIAQKQYKVSERLPSEQELMARLGVSRVTVRQAIAQLVSQGLVVSKQGKGSFVAGPVVHHELEQLRGFYDTLVEQGHKPKTRLLAFQPEAATEAASQAFGEARAMLLKRLYALDGEPFALVRAWLPIAAQRLSWNEAEHHPLYAILQTLLGMQVVRADVGIVARRADAEEAEWLEVEPGSPVLVMERTSSASNGQVLELSRFSIRPEHFRFRLSVQGPLAITSQIQELVAEPKARAARGNPSTIRKSRTQEETR